MHQPHLLLRQLLRGATLGDASYHALLCLSWQNVVVGDPLYRPFARGAAGQWAERASLPGSLQPYAALRELRRLQAANKPAEAVALARAEQQRQPSLAVGLALARLLAAAGDQAGAATALGFAGLLPAGRSDEWGLFRDAAVFLADHGEPGKAVEVYRNLFKAEGFPDDLRVAWLRDAAKTATQAGNFPQAVAWEKQLLELERPPGQATGPRAAP
jgi:hypothetical protein